MINVNMTEKAGVTLATAGKYCADNVKVTPSAEILRKDEQAKSATPTETAQDITPDSGKVLSKVSVGAIPKTYVGSGVTKKAAATVSPSTSEQTVCASGVYTTGEQKVSAITPSIVGNLDADSFASAIVAAIEGKGVDVPSGAKLDALAALIESIEAGGGGGGIEIHSGVYTPASIGTAVSNIPHGFSERPDIVIVFSPTGATSTKNSLFCFAYNITGVNSDGIYYGEYIFSYNYSYGYTQVNHFDIGGSVTNKFFSTDYVDSTYIHDNTNYYFRGKVYWYAIKGVN